MKHLRHFALLLCPLFLLATLAGALLDLPALWHPAAVAAAVALALGLGARESTRGFQFTAWIVVAVTAAMVYPSAFLRWGDLDLRNRWVVLFIVQGVMFGMGTQMKLRDFAGVMKMPWGVFVGLLCQFTIMPLVGFGLARAFSFPPEIAAGIILIGSCSSGLASNVMTYLARANLALSITVTSIATLLAPLLTPMWMKVLAGAMVEVKFLGMMVEIVKIVLVPVGAALLHDFLRTASPRGARVVHGIAVAAALWLAFIALGGWTLLADSLAPGPLLVASLFGFLLGAVLFGVIYHRLARALPVLDEKMPLLSMFGIVYFTTVTTAAGRDNLLAIGALLFIAAMIHNTAGYALGYSLSRLLGLDRQSARAVAFEVGLQNGGMASGLAGAMGKLGTVGLAAAIFSPWMNVSGSILANIWRRRPPR
jgi:BASS family bile acid:Na+ symporter